MFGFGCADANNDVITVAVGFEITVDVKCVVAPTCVGVAIAVGVAMVVAVFFWCLFGNIVCLLSGNVGR